MPLLLPNEVVGQILGDYANDDDDYQLLFTLRWSKLLFVCRQWHDVGISSLKLWSFVNFETSVPEVSRSSWKGAKNILGPIIDDIPLLTSHLEADLRRLTTQLIRAKQYPLTIRINSNFWIQQVAKDIENNTLMESIHAIQRSTIAEPRPIASLSLVGRSDKIRDILEDLALHLRPHLTHLDIEPKYPGLNALSLPDTLLYQQTPSLLNMKLTDVHCNWGLIHDMRSLTIGSLCGSLRIRTDTVIDVLRRSPGLEELQVHLVHLDKDEVAADIIASNDVVSLPRLSSLTLTGHANLGASLFLLLSDVSINAQICMSTIQQEQLDAEIQDLLQARILERLRDPRGPVIRTFAWDRNTNWMSASELTDLRQLPLRGYPYWVNRPYIFMKIGIHPYEPPTAFRDFTKKLPLERATHLDMRQSQYCEKENMEMLFGLMPSLTTVVVSFSQRTAEEMLQVLDSCLCKDGAVRRPARHLIIATGDEHKTCMGISRALKYCSKAKKAGVPLDVLEIITPSRDVKYQARLLMGRSWPVLYRDLTGGFVSDGVLYNEETGDAGTPWTGYARDA